MDSRAIGVFDSGVGGLTVAKEIMRELPRERIVYFGDTARVPYGSKSKETIVKFSRQNIRFLMSKDVKAIVVACGTASATALEAVRAEFAMPIVGVVQPGAAAAARTTRNGRVGIIATEASIRSASYDALIRALNAKIEVFGQACPLFVPLVEEGWIDEAETRSIARRYLAGLQAREVDTLVLGCTHYPLLDRVIGEIMGGAVTLVNPALEAARVLKDELAALDLLSSEGADIEHLFYVSDTTSKFQMLAETILGQGMGAMEVVAIEEF